MWKPIEGKTFFGKINKFSRQPHQEYDFPIFWRNEKGKIDGKDQKTPHW